MTCARRWIGGLTITDVKVLEKHGGKSGDWVAAS